MTGKKFLDARFHLSTVLTRELLHGTRAGQNETVFINEPWLKILGDFYQRLLRFYTLCLQSQSDPPAESMFVATV